MFENHVNQGPVVDWPMPNPMGPLVRYFPNSISDIPSYGFVVAKGESTIDLMIVSPNYRGLIPKGAVRHAEDPNNWKHRTYMGGMWLDLPLNIKLTKETEELRSQVDDLKKVVSEITEVVMR